MIKSRRAFLSILIKRPSPRAPSPGPRPRPPLPLIRRVRFAEPKKVVGWGLSHHLGEDLYDDVTSNHTASSTPAGRSHWSAARAAHGRRAHRRDDRVGRVARNSRQHVADHYLPGALPGGGVFPE